MSGAYWSQVVNRFDTERPLYESEWLMLQYALDRGCYSVLDVGCAQGGLSDLVGDYYVGPVAYTGLDVCPDMIYRARGRYPQHQFHCIPPGDFSCLNGQTYDLVTCLGFLHLTADWKETLREAWKHTKRFLVFDLRESAAPSIEDIRRSYVEQNGARIPYNVIGSSEALREAVSLSPEPKEIRRFGYMIKPDPEAKLILAKIMASVFLVEK